MFYNTMAFIMSKYSIADEGKEVEKMKVLWEEYNKQEKPKKTKVKKTIPSDEERCTCNKADGTRCQMKRSSASVMAKHPEYDPTKCATHNRQLLTPKKTPTKVKKYVCGHMTRKGTQCTTKVLKEGDKCKVYKNMMEKKAREAESEEEKTPKKAPKVPEKAKVEEKHEEAFEEEEHDEELVKALKEIEEEEATQEMEEEDESEDEVPTPKSTKRTPKRQHIIESDDEEE